MSELFPQIDWSIPASAVGASIIVINTLSIIAVQSPFPVLVKVRVTFPAVISAAEGVYIAFRSVLEELYEPEPPLQIPPVAFVTVPAKFTFGLLAHDVRLGPALIIGVG